MHSVEQGEKNNCLKISRNKPPKIIQKNSPVRVGMTTNLYLTNSVYQILNFFLVNSCRLIFFLWKQSLR